jgi:hypothetical protein
MIETFKRFLREIDKIDEVVDVAIKYQCLPNSEPSSEDMAVFLDLAHRRLEHFHKQLVKGIAFLEELQLLEEAAKDMKRVEIYVLPWGQEYDCPVHSNIGYPSQN